MEDANWIYRAWGSRYIRIKDHRVKDVLSEGDRQAAIQQVFREELSLAIVAEITSWGWGRRDISLCICRMRSIWDSDSVMSFTLSINHPNVFKHPMMSWAPCNIAIQLYDVSWTYGQKFWLWFITAGFLIQLILLLCKGHFFFFENHSMLVQRLCEVLITLSWLCHQGILGPVGPWEKGIYCHL